ncbi:Zinc finger protein 354C [Manis javanica]|nr:Zinc finger protein 354C [Manis javanica]
MRSVSWRPCPSSEGSDQKEDMATEQREARSQVLRGSFTKWIPFSKPKVISLLQQGDDPCKVEKESPGGSVLGLLWQKLALENDSSNFHIGMQVSHLSYTYSTSTWE